MVAAMMDKNTASTWTCVVDALAHWAGWLQPIDSMSSLMNSIVS